MKGIIFTEFMNLVESTFGDEVLDQVIEKSKLPNEGAYTAVGTYTSEELARMIINLSEVTGVKPSKLQEVFGIHLMDRLASQYPQFFERVLSLFDFLSSVHEYIRVEVKKLYPDAMLPNVIVLDKNEDSMTLRYESPRKMSHVALGLIKASSNKFKTPIDISLDEQSEDGSIVDFNIKLQ
jgi:hypothetical protein